MQRATGWALRVASGPELITFLDEHAQKMPQLMFAGAIEKLPQAKRKQYQTMRRNN